MKPAMVLTLDGLVRALRPARHTPLLQIDRDREDALAVRAELSTDALRLLALRRVKGIDDDIADR